MRTPPFVGPDRKIDRAYRHYYELQDLVNSYRKSAHAVWVKLDEGPNVWRAEISQPPIECMTVLGDIAHNLRSALDVMLADIAILRGVSDEKLQFPFANNSDEWSQYIAKNEKRNQWWMLGDDVTNAICDVRPYREGNPYLCAVADFNNSDKHRLLCPVTQFVSVEAGIALTNYYVRKGPLEAGVPPDELPIMFQACGPLVAIRDGDVQRREADMPTPNEDLPLDPTRSQICFPLHVREGFAFGGAELLNFAEQAISSVIAVVDRFRPLIL